MFLFSRSARLNSNNGIEWATATGKHAAEVLGNEVQLWTTAFSPAAGTLSWTSWWADLSSLESGMGGLLADAEYNALAAQGAKYIDGGVGDLLGRALTGGPSAGGSAMYVAGVRAVCAAGNAGRAMAAGVEIAQKYGEITGSPSMFVRGLTGTYGGVGWLTGVENLGAFEAAENKLAADPGWLTYLDGTAGCFVEDAAVTQSTLYVKLA